MDAEEIKRRLKATGKSQAGLALALGIDPAGVNRLLKGDRQLKASEVSIVETYLGEKPKTVPTTKVPSQNFSSRPVDSVADLSFTILGMAEGGPDGWNLFNGEPVEVRRRPDNLIGVADAYGVYVLNNSMEPRYFHGDILHVHPHKPVEPGCFVVVQRKPLHDGEAPLAVVKRLVRRTAQKVILEQLNPSKTIEVPASDVVSIHRVVGSSEA